MPSRKSLKRRVCVHVRLDEDLFAYFEAFYLSHTEGRKKHGFGQMVEELLLKERDRRVTAHAIALAAQQQEPGSDTADTQSLPVEQAQHEQQQ